MGFWDDARVLVTGGAGFIGSHVVDELLRRGKGLRVAVADDLSRGSLDNLRGSLDRVHLEKTDLSVPEECRRVCDGQDLVLHLAAKVGGVGYNAAHPATMFRENVRLDSNIIEAASLSRVKRLLVVSSACVYRHHCTIPTPESEGFLDWPEGTNEGYGWAKRMAEFEAMAAGKEHGLRCAVVRPCNAYGPRDHFDEESSHVIAALIRRVTAGEDPLLVWGDGKSTRSFLYAEDFARGLLDLFERCQDADPVNLGTEEEVSIGDLASMIVRLAGSSARIVFDPSKPSGQPRRRCDIAKSRRIAGFAPRVGLEEGLRRTLAWYKESYGA
ncbi:MAG: NAD-dependent epimerase/dehydratase family protein [Elusimicrobiota bacterium]